MTFLLDQITKMFLYKIKNYKTSTNLLVFYPKALNEIKMINFTLIRGSKFEFNAENALLLNHLRERFVVHCMLFFLIQEVSL